MLHIYCRTTLATIRITRVFTLFSSLCDYSSKISASNYTKNEVFPIKSSQIWPYKLTLLVKVVPVFLLTKKTVFENHTICATNCLIYCSFLYSISKDQEHICLTTCSGNHFQQAICRKHEGCFTDFHMKSCYSHENESNMKHNACFKHFIFLN